MVVGGNEKTRPGESGLMPERNRDYFKVATFFANFDFKLPALFL